MFDLSPYTLFQTDKFLPRDVMLSAVFAVGRCPSVRPSDTFVCCIQTAEGNVKLNPCSAL